MTAVNRFGEPIQPPGVTPGPRTARERANRSCKAIKQPARRSVAGYPSAYLPAICRSLNLPEPVAEYQFAPPRRWRFDWAWPEQMVAIEIEGGVFVAGRHSRGAGMVKDMEKYNRATCMGWRILRYTPSGLAKCLPDLAMVLK